MKRLANKIALITGAAGGQGRVEAMLFARQGAVVVATDMDQAGLASLADEAAVAGLHIEIEFFDVSDAKAWTVLVDAIIARHGRIDILVNNAAIYARGLTLEGLSAERWQQFLDINLSGVLHGVAAVIPHMKRQSSGAVVNVASIAAIRGGMGIAYSASKAGMLGLSRDLAVEVGRFGVRVNTLIPGPIDTAMLGDAVATAESRQAIEDTIVLRRLGRPEEIANAVLFLASDEASFVTGAELVVDGGRTIK